MIVSGIISMPGTPQPGQAQVWAAGAWKLSFIAPAFSLAINSIPMRGAVDGTLTDSGLTSDASESVAICYLPPGSDPINPANGDIWNGTNNPRCRLAGVTYDLPLIQAAQNTFTGGVASSSATAGVGYATGAGGTVGQLTNKATGVTLNKVCGTITLNAAALASATSVAFVLTDSAIAATDQVVINHDSVGTLGGYSFAVTPAAGSATITVRNLTAGSLSEAIVLRFAVIKAVVI